MNAPHMNAPHPTPAALETQVLCLNFGALTVADAIDLRLERGARHALIGPNGAGKTTFVNLVTGRLSPNSGRILLNGEDITTLGRAARVKRGIARTFQISALFRRLTLLENVTLAVSERVGIASDILRSAGRHTAVIDEAYTLLQSLGIAQDALREVHELPYGRQRLAEIAIALGSNPSVLLLDEPAAGVPSGESGIIAEIVARLPADLSLLIIEHDMELVFRIAKRISVLVQGRVLVEGAPEAIAADRRVREVYLGEHSAGAPRA